MIPLATELRPVTLADFLGQSHLVDEGGPIKAMIDSGIVYSMIFWGPPATGKTTLARIIASSVGAEFVELSAVLEGKAKLKSIVDEAIAYKKSGKNTIVFVDEIHRWNKAQQDALLPYVEEGLITLLGATTENPSFSIIAPLLSRSRVFVFESLSKDDILVALTRGVNKLIADGIPLVIEQDVLEYIAELSNGDVRFALNTLQIASNTQANSITRKLIEQSANKFLRHDKKGDEHYTIISAVHKSLRSSNPSAATYWVMRMLEAGEDPLYIARRLIRFASEDIGNASPTALILANAVYDTCKTIGMPECAVSLVQLCEYLARAPKNNSAYVAHTNAQKDVKQFGNLSVPLGIRNAPTKLMKELGYGNGYEYDHDVEGKKSDQQLMPDELLGKEYF